MKKLLSQLLLPLLSISLVLPAAAQTYSWKERFTGEVSLIGASVAKAPMLKEPMEGSQVLVDLEAGEKVVLRGYNNWYWKVEKDKLSGYIHINYIYAELNADFKLGQLKLATENEELSKPVKWDAKLEGTVIRYNGDMAEVPFRKAPYDDAGLIRLLKSDEKVAVTGYEPGGYTTGRGDVSAYWEVTKDGTSGYIKTAYLNVPAEANRKARMLQHQYADRMYEAQMKEKAEKPARVRKAYGAETGNRILRKEVWVGMTIPMVRESVGEPKSINRNAAGGAGTETWNYANPDYEFIELQFQNGTLQRIGYRPPVINVIEVR